MSTDARAIYKEANQHLYGVSIKEGRVYWRDFPETDEGYSHDAAAAKIKEVSDILAGAGLKLRKPHIEDNCLTAEIVSSAWRRTE